MVSEGSSVMDAAAGQRQHGEKGTQTMALQSVRIGKTFSNQKGTAVTALTGVDLCVPYGKKVALIGPDGAGKTTFLRLACGLFSPSEGTMDVLGLAVETDAGRIQAKVGYMPQRFGLYEDLSVQENMNLYADLLAVPKEVREERIRHLLTLTGLAPFTGRLAGRLSGGMKQKLGLACTLLRMPPLLLLDEPTVGVDPLSRREVWEIIDTVVKDEGMTVLVSTGYMEEAEQADFVYIIDQGRILASGTPQEVTDKAVSRCFSLVPTAGISARMLQALFLSNEQILDAVPDGRQVRLTLRAGGNPRQLETALPGIPLSFTPVAPRLEDSFMICLHQASRTASSRETPLPPPDWTVGSPSGGGKTVIEVRELVRRFGDFTAVDRTSFSVQDGEIFGLLGPNGAGKTTTFRMLCGLLPATSGTLFVAGQDLRRSPAEARRNIGYVAQKFSLYTMLSVRENLEFFGGVYGLLRQARTERISEVLEEFHLLDVADTLAGSLPLGYKQRLSMAAALLHKPKILFLDEATSGIDPLARRSFWYRITNLAAAGTTIVITTHFMEEAAYCDRIMIQDQGQTIALGTPAAIMEQGEAEDMNHAFIHIVEKKRAERKANPV